MGFAPFTSERRHFLVEHDSWNDLMIHEQHSLTCSWLKGIRNVNDVFLMILETWH